MYSLAFQWKEFNLNLTDVEVWLNANAGEHYLGNSADTQLTLWFSEEPIQQVKDDIEAYWDALDDESDEAVNYVSGTAIKDAINTLRAGIPAKDWDDMSVAERKIVLGQQPTNAELGL